MPARSSLSLFVSMVTVVVWMTGIVMTAHADAPFKPIPPDQVNKDELEKARRIAETTLSNWRDGKFEPRGDEFTAAMKKASTPARQKAASQGIKDLFGDYQSLKYVEAVASKDMPEFVLYRFRGTFSGTDERPEIRIVINQDGKVAGVWIKHWRHEVK